MKNLILCFLLLSGLNSFAQGWKPVKLDSTVTFELPNGFKKTKTDSASTFSATTSFGTILIFKAVDNPALTPDIEKQKQLTRFYNDYMDRVQKSSGDGKITNEKDTMLGDLKVKDFTLEIDTGSGPEMRKFRILHANNSTYAFEFLFDKVSTEYASDECNKFFNSIKVNNKVEPAAQFSENTANDRGINPFMIGGGILLVIALVVFLFIRKKKVVS